MARSAGIAIVEDFLSALARNDADAALAFMSDDIVYQNVPLPPDRGKAKVARTLRVFQRVMKEFSFEMLHVAETNGVVLTERIDVIRGPLLDLRFWVCGTFEIKDTKITLWRDRFDVASFTLQLLTSPVRRAFRGHHPAT
jgi:limonene-1,2-epoxide hydrolase